MLVLGAFVCSGQTLGTPFYAQFYNADGSPQTNIITMQVWPPDDNAFTVDGTNVIFGDRIYTNTPTATGFWTNRLFANTYVVKIPSAGRSFFVKLLDTQTYLPLATYVTNVANVGTAFTLFNLLTNGLGFIPANASNLNAGFLLSGTIPDARQSANMTRFTNQIVTSISNASASAFFLSRWTNADGSFWYAASNAAAIWHAPTLAEVDAAKPGIPTNQAAIDLLKPFLMTNYTTMVADINYVPATNTYAAATNLLQASRAIVDMMGFTPLANTSIAIFTAMGFVPPNITNTPGMFTAGPDLFIITNGAPGPHTPLLIYTNLGTGIAPVFNAPSGSELIASNGASYHMTNTIWRFMLNQ